MKGDTIKLIKAANEYVSSTKKVAFPKAEFTRSNEGDQRSIVVLGMKKKKASPPAPPRPPKKKKKTFNLNN